MEILEDVASGANFWKLHHQLGECYELEMKAMQDEVQRLSNLVPYLPPETSVSQVSKASKASKTALSAASVRSPRLPRLRSHTSFTSLGVPLPEDDVQMLEVAPSGSLWNSAAFQEDLQACLARKRTMDAMNLIAGDDEARTGEEDLVFNPRTFWNEQIDSTEQKQISRVNARTRRSSVLSVVPVSSIVRPEHRTSRSHAFFRMLQHPGSAFRAWWDALGMMMLAYDLVVIPLRVFDLGESTLLLVMFWVAHLYWNLAIPISFITGYDDAGLLVLDLRRTAKSYLRSWFVFDLALVSLDWTILALDPSAAGVARLSRTARSLRFLRLLRLGRAVRIGSVIQSIQDHLSSRMVNIQYSILKIIVQLIISNHIIACLWFGLGIFEDEGEPTWMKELELETKSPAYQYATSLQWAFCQLGVGQTEIEAVNLNERIFSVVVSFLGFINFSTMVSSMTSLLARLQKLKNQELEQFSLLRRFLSTNQIDPDLSHRVTRFLQHTYALKHMALSKDSHVPILEMLSKPLQEELQLQRHHHCLNDSGFLRKLLNATSNNFHRVICDLVTSCMMHSVLALDDVAFAAGTVATACYYVADGHCRYENQSMVPSKLRNTWVAEACLWTPWLHLGNLISQDITRLITIQVAAFCECIAKDQAARRLAAAYALDFVRRLNKKKHWSDVHLSDTRTLQQPLKLEQSRGSCGWCPRRSIFSKVLPG